MKPFMLSIDGAKETRYSLLSWRERIETRSADPGQKTAEGYSLLSWRERIETIWDVLGAQALSCYSLLSWRERIET